MSYPIFSSYQPSPGHPSYQTNQPFPVETQSYQTNTTIQAQFNETINQQWSQNQTFINGFDQQNPIQLNHSYYQTIETQSHQMGGLQNQFNEAGIQQGAYNQIFTNCNPIQINHAAYQMDATQNNQVSGLQTQLNETILQQSAHNQTFMNCINQHNQSIQQNITNTKQNYIQLNNMLESDRMKFDSLLSQEKQKIDQLERQNQGLHQRVDELSHFLKLINQQRDELYSTVQAQSLQIEQMKKQMFLKKQIPLQHVFQSQLDTPQVYNETTIPITQEINTAPKRKEIITGSNAAIPPKKKRKIAHRHEEHDQLLDKNPQAVQFQYERNPSKAMIDLTQTDS